MTWPDEFETPVELNAGEIHVLICAMAGNFPETLAEHRMPVLRKLAKASRAVGEFREAYTNAGRAAGLNHRGPGNG